jgi:hypothetical protein
MQQRIVFEVPDIDYETMIIEVEHLRKLNATSGLY